MRSLLRTAGRRRYHHDESPQSSHDLSSALIFVAATFFLGAAPLAPLKCPEEVGAGAAGAGVMTDEAAGCRRAQIRRWPRPTSPLLPIRPSHSLSPACCGHSRIHSRISSSRRLRCCHVTSLRRHNLVLELCAAQEIRQVARALLHVTAAASFLQVTEVVGDVEARALRKLFPRQRRRPTWSR